MVLYHQGINAMAAAEGIFDLLEAPVTVREPAEAEAAARTSFEPAVRFEHVNFAYREGGRPALRDVSLELRAGEKLGVVGPSGAGKSTLVSLMLRFGDPQEGRVLLGGQDIRTIPLQVLRRHIAVVAQDMYLFYGTIADNLRMAKPEAAPEEIAAAARAANVHSSPGCPRGTTPSWASAASASPAASASALPSPGPFSRTPRSWCWTRRCRAWTPRARR